MIRSHLLWGNIKGDCSKVNHSHIIHTGQDKEQTCMKNQDTCLTACTPVTSCSTQLPGPLAFLEVSLPSRRITAFSYSFTIYKDSRTKINLTVPSSYILGCVGKSLFLHGMDCFTVRPTSSFSCFYFYTDAAQH